MRVQRWQQQCCGPGVRPAARGAAARPARGDGVVGERCQHAQRQRAQHEQRPEPRGGRAARRPDGAGAAVVVAAELRAAGVVAAWVEHSRSAGVGEQRGCGRAGRPELRGANVPGVLGARAGGFWDRVSWCALPLGP